MAAWQFDLNAVCSQSGTSLPADYRSRVSTFLDGLLDGTTEPGGWTMYGPADGNRIDLAFDDDGCELDVRIDARTEADSFISLVCVLMADLRCTLYSAELGEFVGADVQAVKAALQRSDAWRFALDPKGFIASKAGD